MSNLTHFDAEGNAVMVDVSAKDETLRTATARARVSMQQKTLKRILDNKIEKGDVLGIARIAGIQAAKKTPDLIPLCHPLPLSSVKVAFETDEKTGEIEITATCKLTGRTGVEMEALTAVSVAALTIYDMCKAIDKGITVSDIRLTHKAGGKSGTYEAP